MAALRRPCGLPGLVACAAEGSGGEAAVEDAEYYSVAAIRGKQVVANAVTGMMEVYYLVKWAGFDESENTWELASSLTADCDDALRATISDFEANERAKKEASGGTDLQPAHFFGYGHGAHAPVHLFIYFCRVLNLPPLVQT